MDRLTLEIATPERLVLSESVDSVILPSVEGYMGVQPGHAPLLARLDVGEIVYRKNGEQRFLSVAGGFAEVLRTSVQVLARTCEAAEEIDVARAERARDLARERMQSGVPVDELRHAEVRLKRAVTRIGVSRKTRG